MNFTNNYGLPIPIAIWLSHNTYQQDEDENVISATTLLKSVRQIVLGRRYKESTKVVDVMDLAASKIGAAIHASVEAAMEPDTFIKLAQDNFGIKPKEFHSEIRTKKEINGYVISGQFDIVYAGTVLDIKSTSTWKYILDSGDDYIKQMSIYKWLNPELITNPNGYICYIFTDWSKAKARMDTKYPQQRIMWKEFVLDENIEEWIDRKTRAIKAAESLPDNDLPFCTSEERWEKPTVWKYYKGASRERATKVYDNEYEAYERMKKDGGAVVEIKGESTGCMYCSYSNICNQYKIIHGDIESIIENME